MSTSTDPNPPPDTSSTTFTEGQLVAGCYSLTKRIGVIDGKEAWLAQDEVLGKAVMLQFLAGTINSDSAALQELRQEVKRARQLIHPHILRIYDLVEETGCSAISTNAFEGESIAARLEKQPGGRFAASDIEAWALQLIQTIEDAHKIHVMHRGLAPGNVFLTHANQLLVINFGIDRTLREALARAGKGHAEQDVYSSPQTLEGKASTPADDVYSLGAIFYRLLVGAAPFSGGDIAGQVRAGISAAALAALSKPDLHIPATWQKAIGASLQKAPEARPQTAGEMLRALKAESGSAATPVVAAKAPSPELPSPVATSTPVEPPQSKRAIEFSSVEPVPAPVRLESITPPEQEEAEIARSAESAPSRAVADPSRGMAEKAPLSRLEPKKPAGRNPMGEFKPKLYPEESQLPVFWIAAAAAAVVLLLVVYHFVSSARKGNEGKVAPTENVAPEKAQLKELTQTPAPPKVVTSLPKPPATPSGPTPEQVAAAQAAQAAAQAAQAGLVEAQKTFDQKQADLTQAKRDAEMAEKSHASIVEQQRAAEIALEQSKKAVAEQAKASDAAKAVVAETMAQQKKVEADQKAAEAAAQEAQKVAAEKAALVAQGKKSLTDLAKKTEDEVAAQEKAKAQLDELQKVLTEKQSALDTVAKAAAAAEAERQQKAAAAAAVEKGMAASKADLEEKQKKSSTTQTELKSVTPAPNDMLQSFKEKMAQLQNSQNNAPAGTPVPISHTSPVPTTATAHATPPSAATPAAATPPRSTPTSVELTLLTTPPPTMQFPKPGTGVANSLGLKFVPIGDVDFSIWLTRVKDFEVFAKAVNLKSTSWKTPGFQQGPDHPVVNVTWLEAMAFCKWLSDREHKEGSLAAEKYYRLPTDLEWSKAVGLPEESGKTPEQRDMGVPEVYPWGTGWPPPAGAGNYTGEETGSDVAIKGYDDGFAWTSPVGSFKPNKYGLYDMGGNVWQWCMDNWNNESKAKVLRGASWYNGALKLSLLSSCRVHAAPDSSTDNYGFRIVRATEPVKAGKKIELR